MEQACILVPPPIPSLSQPLHTRCLIETWWCCFRRHTSVVLAVVLANTVLAWSNRPKSMVGAARGGKWRDQEEVVMVHTWTSVVVELAWPSLSGSSCR